MYAYGSLKNVCDYYCKIIIVEQFLLDVSVRSFILSLMDYILL